MTRRQRGTGIKRKGTRGKATEAENERDIIVLFADVVSCSEISNHLSLSQYNDFITHFHECFDRVCEYYRKKVYEPHERPLFQYGTRGDEGCVKIFVSRNKESLARDVDVAISIALDLKRMWLFTPHNRRRILDDKLLPIELAIGVHLGKVFINEDPHGNGGGHPEGYAINLAKRIENASRGGKFSHILLSESAHGQLYYLKDESVYKFEKPFIIETKGISHAIKASEIKHHFLPTDWTDVIEEEPWELSMVYKELSSENILEIAEKAYEINPTNLWLAEEYIILTMFDAYGKSVHNKDGNGSNLLDKGYESVLKIAQRITNSHLRDGTLLSTCGWILGELKRYQEEEEAYREAIRLEDTDAEFHWYLGLCISYQLDEAQKENGEIHEFYTKNNKRIEEIFREYKRALALKPIDPWITYDYACELSWWSQADESLRQPAIDMVIIAFGLYSDITDWAQEEKYLKPIIKDPDVKKYLK